MNAVPNKNTKLKSKRNCAACMVGKRSQGKCVDFLVERTRIQRKLAASSISMIGQSLHHEQYNVFQVCE